MMSQTGVSIHEKFEAEGISIREWALANGFKPRTVYAVIYGELKCKRGVSHEIAVKLGIKPRPEKLQFRVD